MTRRRKRWLLAAGAAVVAAAGGMALAGWWAARNAEPFLREQTVAYLERRFDADVDLQRVKVRLRWRSTWDVLLHRGEGAEAEVEAGPLTLRLRKDARLPPVLEASGVKFTVDVGTLGGAAVMVRRARVEGLVIHVPPRRGRRGGAGTGAANVVIGELEAPGSRLVLLPRDAARAPLEFGMHRLVLRSAGRGRPMRYETELTNAKPPGQIRCRGSLGRSS